MRGGDPITCVVLPLHARGVCGDPITCVAVRVCVCVCGHAVVVVHGGFSEFTRLAVVH